MPPRTGRHGKVLKNVRDAIAMSRSGATVINDGEAAIYFLWGQPSHAIFRDQDGEVEGMAALKAIAFSLSAPGGKVSWEADQVIQRETLLITGDDLITTLEKLSVAPKQAPAATESDAWDGRSRRMTDALEYDLADFPLLPAGVALWADVPANVVHLDVLLQSLPTVLVSFKGPDVRAVCIVIHGQIVDGLYVDGKGSRRGAPAARALLSAPEGLVSAYEIDEITAEALPLLWRSRVAYRDMDIRWLEPHAFLDALRADGEDRAVIVSTPDEIGVALVRHGLVAATYTTETPKPQPTTDLMLGLFAAGRVGSVTVLEGVVRDDDEGVQGVAAAPAEAPPAPPPTAGGAPIITPPGMADAAADVRVPADEPPEAPQERPDPGPIVDPVAAPTWAVPAPAEPPAVTPWDQPADPTAALQEQPAPASEEQPGPASEEQPAPASEEQPAPASEEQPAPASEEQPAPASDWLSIASDADGIDPGEAGEAGEPEPDPDPGAALPWLWGPEGGSSAVDTGFAAPASPEPDVPQEAAWLAVPAQPSAPAPPPALAPDATPAAAPAQTPLFAFFNTELSSGAAPPVAPVPEPTSVPLGEGEADYDGVIEELEAIAIRFLGPDAGAVAMPIVQCPHTVPALRQAITSLRAIELTDHTADEITEMTRTMLRAVADRLTAA